jgi:hypothetical protein
MSSTNPNGDTPPMSDEARHNLVGFIETLIEMDQAQKALQARLKDKPEGFSIVGEGTRCSLCDRHFYEEMWYDKWGGKCFDCQDAVDKRIVPGSICRDFNNEKHVIATELSYRTGLHVQTIKKLARQGKLKARAFKGQNGEVWVFLRKENPNLAEVIQEELRTKDIKPTKKETYRGSVIVKEVNRAADPQTSVRKMGPLSL